MDSAYVYEQNTVINELTQGIEMAKQLRCNLNSAEARQFFIQKILSSYENALFILKSGDSTGQPQAAAMPAPSLPESSKAIESTQSGKFDFDYFDQLDLPFIYQQDQDVVSRKRKGSTVFDTPNKEKHTFTNGHGAQSAAPPQPFLLEQHEIMSTHQHNHYHHQLSPPNLHEMIPNLNANLSFNKWVLDGADVPSSFSFPSMPFGFMEDYQQLHFPNHVDNELLQVCSPTFISPATSELNYFSEWESSHSMDFAADLAPDFNFHDSYF